MELNIKDNLKYYTFENFKAYSDFTKHCFSTKFGGVSKGVYESMNLSFRNDSRENVLKNYEIICNEIGVNYKNSVFSSQIHEDKIHVVKREDVGKGLIRDSDLDGIDALITNEIDLPLITFYADCVAVFMLDPVKKVIGIAHSGWRGTLLEISAKTALAMKENFGSELEDILVGVSPSIGRCCFQVGGEVVEQFENRLEFSKEYIHADTDENNQVIENKFKIDLQNIIKTSLVNVGILEKNIELSNICTMCNSDMFFSHRVMGNERGSLAGIIGLV